MAHEEHFTVGQLPLSCLEKVSIWSCQGRAVTRSFLMVVARLRMAREAFGLAMTVIAASTTVLTLAWIVTIFVAIVLPLPISILMLMFGPHS